MPKKAPVEDVIPPQDGKICGTICICQMTLVLSSVALVYLTVAIYMPSTRAFSSGINPEPIMCTTTKMVHKDSCDWISCGEWCLSKSTGPCDQIYVNLRTNGSSITFNNCTNSANKTCYGIDQENSKKARCIADECKNLTGTFNCTAGACINITDAFECHWGHLDPPLKCSGRRGKITCIEIAGLFACDRGTCSKILPPYNCDRRCVDIPTRHKNIMIFSGDKVILSQCESAVTTNTAVEVWNETQENILMVSCHTIKLVDETIETTDCINGSVMQEKVPDLANFTYLTTLHIFKAIPQKLIAPIEQELTLWNDSKLMINLEGCVNTLSDECRDFMKDYGKDGTDHNARARFPCFYSDFNKDVVVARFDLEVTYKQFLFASTVPSVLFVVSCIVLILCQRTVVVGDDAKMRFLCLGADPNGGSSLDGGAEGVASKSTSQRNMGNDGGGGTMSQL